jgi:hypothetical protein
VTFWKSLVIRNARGAATSPCGLEGRLPLREQILHPDAAAVGKGETAPTRTDAVPKARLLPCSTERSET